MTNPIRQQLSKASEPIKLGLNFPSVEGLGFFDKQFIARLQQAKVSAISIEFPDGQRISIGVIKPNTEQAVLKICSSKFYLKVWAGGLLGFAEAYMEGFWQTQNLYQLTQWGLANLAALEQVFKAKGVSRYLHSLVHKFNANSRRGSRKNIAYHYDLGNDFYRHWLDLTMSYSSALYERNSHAAVEQTMEQAQLAKYDRVLELCELKPGDKILEIGCGWGGLAERVSQQHPRVNLRGITLSQQQLNWARQRLKQGTGADNIELAYQDYRDITGQYQRIASIEMFEAVGEEHWPGYFKKIHESLSPGGVAVLQVICIAEERFEKYRSSADFIQRYIFPGGMLPAPSCIERLCQQQGLDLEYQQEFGIDYADTLAYWRSKFYQSWPQLQKLGFDQRFRRMWEYYLCYCESGFRHKTIDVRLFKIRKPLN